MPKFFFGVRHVLWEMGRVMPAFQGSVWLTWDHAAKPQHSADSVFVIPQLSTFSDLVQFLQCLSRKSPTLTYPQSLSIASSASICAHSRAWADSFSVEDSACNFPATTGLLHTITRIFHTVGVQVNFFNQVWPIPSKMYSSYLRKLTVIRIF